MTRRRRTDEDDPIARYREWVDNRYNPGHWLGGNVPPSVRNLWSPKDRRWLGSAYIAVCAIGFSLAISRTHDADDVIVVSIALLPWLIPGLIMLLSRDVKKRRPK
jgi:hypothetical protein